MFKIAICDDNKVFCSDLESMIFSIINNLPCDSIKIEKYYSGESLMDDLNENNIFDLIFLDIELKKANGIEVGHYIRNKLEDYITKIIYISSKNSYDRQLFDVQPLHFLQKPINIYKLEKDILLALKLSNKLNNLFEFKINRQTVKVPFNKILYFESKGRKIKIHTIDEDYIFYGKISDINTKTPNFFIVPHNSYLVNYNLIKQFKPNEFIMCNNSIIPICRNKKKSIQKIQLELERK